MFTFYDDELHNLILVADKNIKEIIAYTAHYDYHTPVQYILNKIFLSIFGLNEFWLSVPSIIFIIISIILCFKIVVSITGSIKYGILCGAVIAVNPLILLWGSSIRWYPVWTFLIILSFYQFIKLWGSKDKKILLISTLILILAFSLYINYLTIPFLFTALVTAILLDIQNKKWNRTKQTGSIIAGVIILFAPYLPTFFFHLENFFIRKNIYKEFTGTSPLIAGGYFLFSVLFGQSIFPWNIAFIILFGFGFICLVTGLFFLFLNKRKSGKDYFTLPASKISGNTAIINYKLFNTVLLFTLSSLVIFLISAVISDTLVNRGILFIPMLLIIVTGCYWFYLYKLYKLKEGYSKIFYSLSAALISLLILWFISSYNVLTKQHLHKSGLEIPVNEITGIIKNYKKENSDKFSVITTDFVLTYYLLKDTKVNVLSPYSDDLAKLPGINNRSKIGNQDRIIFIASYPGALMPLKVKLDSYKNYLFTSGSTSSDSIKLGYDPDYEMKSKFFPSSGIEEWRYKIYILKPVNSWNIEMLKKIQTLKVY